MLTSASAQTSPRQPTRERLKPRVLLVDDHAENRQSLADVLVHSGYEVHDAADVLEAIARIRALPVDVVLADIRMEAEDDGLRLSTA